MVILEDKYITGAFVHKLPDKSFTILNGGKLEIMQQADGKNKENLVLPVKLSTNESREWIPNETSKKKLRSKFGDDTDKWKDKKAVWVAAKQNVRGEMKDVIFIE